MNNNIFFKRNIVHILDRVWIWEGIMIVHSPFFTIPCIIAQSVWTLSRQSIFIQCIVRKHLFELDHVGINVPVAKFMKHDAPYLICLIYVSCWPNAMEKAGTNWTLASFVHAMVSITWSLVKRISVTYTGCFTLFISLQKNSFSF